MSAQVHLPFPYELRGADCKGRPFPVYDAVFGPLWLFVNEFDDDCIVRARSLEAALDTVIDNLPPVDGCELNDVKAHWDGTGALPEGFYFQPNSAPTTSGIVDLGIYWAIHPLTQEDLQGEDIVLRVSELV